MTWEVRQGDCVEQMREMDEASVDAIVTDPPYGLEFMGKEWDRLGDIGQASHQGFDTEGNFKGFKLASYNASANVKCRRCQKWKWDHEGRKCECEPFGDFPNVKADQGRRMAAWHQAWATEALRVLKPGGHLLAFGGTRTSHRLACAIEDAGFEIRDSLIWLYGSGFPKSLDVSKAIDKAAGAEREVLGPNRYDARRSGTDLGVMNDDGWEPKARVDTAPATPEAQRWQGWGTALKPGHEPIVVARKPLSGTVAQTVLEHGTGALNVDGCRVDFRNEADRGDPTRFHGTDGGDFLASDPAATEVGAKGGRWPANVVLSHLPECEVVGERKVRPGNGSGRASKQSSGQMLPLRDGGDYESPGGGYVAEDGTETVTAYNCAPGCPVAELDAQSGERPGFSGGGTKGAGFRAQYVAGERGNTNLPAQTFSDSGGASRFFYCAKSSRSERNAGLEGKPFRYGEEREAFEEQRGGGLQGTHDGSMLTGSGNERNPMAANHHPTVKPLALMRWLCRLVTPPDGLILDPFVGSGTTGIAAILEDFDFIGIEREAEYVEIAKARIQHHANQPVQLGLDAA